ncbi:MAG: DUF3298 domain-containing protein [Clostridia bacterium]|nr:DUF3298 domain-containing protein [Clostridia bacterium]
MKKVVILTILVVLIIVIAAVLIYLNGNGTPTDNSGDIPIFVPASAKYALVETTPNSTNGKVNISGRIPYFLEEASEDDDARALSDLNFAKEVNNQIYDVVNTYSEEILLFKDGVSYDDKDNDIINNKQYRYTIDYERYNNGNFISLVLLLNYNTGGLRSNVWKEIFNVDVVNNKIIKLSDLFSSSTYKYEIAKEINKQAKERYINLLDEEGIKSIPDDQKFYIKDEKLIIYFEKSAIGKDELEFTMPYEFYTLSNCFVLK